MRPDPRGVPVRPGDARRLAACRVRAALPPGGWSSSPRRVRPDLVPQRPHGRRATTDGPRLSGGQRPLAVPHPAARHPRSCRSRRAVHHRLIVRSRPTPPSVGSAYPHSIADSGPHAAHRPLAMRTYPPANRRRLGARPRRGERPTARAVPGRSDRFLPTVVPSPTAETMTRHGAARRPPHPDAGPSVRHRDRVREAARRRRARGAHSSPGGQRVTPARRLPSLLSSSRHRNGHPLSGWPFPKDVRRCPTLPQGRPCSTIGAERLSFRVRNVTGRFPLAMAAETLWMFWSARRETSCGSRPYIENHSVDANTLRRVLSSHRLISTGQLHVLPRFHIRPINPVV